MTGSNYDKTKHRKWREKVINRAQGICERCKRYDRRDRDGNPIAAKIAHHKLPVEEFPELAYAMSNGEALCPKCHNEEHPEKGRR